MQQMRQTGALLFGFQHAEAYCLMLYRDSQGNEEWIWNSRDGVTPLVVTSREGHEARHAEWHRGRFLPQHLPAVGERIFITTTLEIQRTHRRTFVDRWWDDQALEMPARFASKEAAVEELAAADMEIPGQPTLMVVTPVVQALLAQRPPPAVGPCRTGS